MIDTSFLDQLGRFHLAVSKRVTSVYTGPRKSIAYGRGLVFKDHRIYAIGDDFRTIDWRVYARTDDLYVKTYEEERNLVVHTIIDSSASMDFGKNVTKFDYASMLGVGFAYLALRDNEKFQFATYGEDLQVFQSRRGMSQLASMVFYLNNAKPKGKSKLYDAISHYRKIVSGRSLIVVISDFLVNINEIKESLLMLGNQDVKVIQVLDPVEKELKMEGEFKLKDSETNDVMKTYVSPRLRVDYQNMLDQHAAEIHDTCNKLGMHFFQVTTDVPVFDTFYHMLE